MPPTINRSDYLFVREILRGRAGHELGEGKEYLVESRLAPLADARALSGIAPLLDRIRSARDRSLEQEVVEAMMTGETSFFRNPSAYERLERVVLPDVVARKTNRRLRIWSAGCSTGQEPYSLAMLVFERYPELLSWDFAIIATDISDAAIRAARDAAYNDTELRRGLTPEQIRVFFETVGNRKRPRPEIRRLVRFERINLIEPLPFRHEFDIVFLRNVLIYFDPAIKPRIFQAVRDAMTEESYLFLGESETILGVSDAFRLAEGRLDCFRPVEERV
ncbi:MAG: protein-glutamate O-methyltransferase CheR [Isosphaeraceae bacterium]|nr:protein-glutamate O-methyltransferase CheR [Isosphaeraceae bacterium]